MLAVKGIQNVESAEGPLSVEDVFTNTIFRNIVLSLLATLGLYLLASLIFVSFFFLHHWTPWDLMRIFSLSRGI